MFFHSQKVLFLSCLTSIFALQIVRHGYMPRRHKISYLDDMQITKDRGKNLPSENESEI